ncbi:MULTISPECIES: type VII secretion protein EccB [Tsukamurella]|uniref:Type VII secretion protein EccB n=1 Tax=Tsukamurella strandjordii TaxID=147577 RepID=A0AA90NDD5_9ACTN|nr:MULTISPECIES: type VII secretion protein EccB [Tsukamurella]MDP0397138.1 type VII secretion protein EccB [Tsukamurella strandjordii]GIZ96943.1 ESX-1 secretion system protein eccB1 [Tsukamurella sp. TY48]
MADINPDPNNPKSGLQERVRGFRLTSKYQKSGESYLQRRNEEALVRRDTRWIDDVKKYQGSPLYVALAAGLVVALGCIIAAVIFPAGKVGDGDLIQDSQTGALYVKVGDALSPVPNVTSGQLIVGSPAKPVQAKSAEIEKMPRGPMVGIPYAPNVIRNSDSQDSKWAVCDTTATGAAVPLDPNTGLPTTATSAVKVTLIGGDLSPAEGTDDIAGNAARVVSFDGQTWLLYQDRGVVARARLDLRNSAIREALGIRIDEKVIPMSAGLFNALASREPIDVPPIVDAGKPARFPNTERILVGTTVRVPTVDGGWTYYVVAADGIQQVSQTAASILQTASPVRSGVVEIDSAKANQWPKVGGRIAVDHFPSGTVRIVDAAADPVTCYSWARSGDQPTATQRVMVARTLPLTQQQNAARIRLIGAPASQGTIADDVYMPATTGRYVYVTGSAADTREQGGQFWVADTGIRYGIDDQGSNQQGSSAKALGLANPVPAPWTIVSLFAQGPTLSKASASIKHDGGPDDPVVATIDPKGAK